ncbi:hypothetical protein evm_006128 [Chilo suppressalis]|nr:hypothetical protein evm_006128 [Chilo suppressalis]
MREGDLLILTLIQHAAEIGTTESPTTAPAPPGPQLGIRSQPVYSNLTHEACRSSGCVSVAYVVKWDQFLFDATRHKSCFLRPDTGPCRADIIQWYFDVKQRKCYRFFWGGCQGNGNRFESKHECLQSCFLNKTTMINPIPNFCSLAFDYGNCFGFFNRWTWDTFSNVSERHGSLHLW